MRCKRSNLARSVLTEGRDICSRGRGEEGIEGDPFVTRVKPSPSTKRGTELASWEEVVTEVEGSGED